MGCMQVAAVAGWVPNTAPPAEQRAETDNAFAPTTCHCGLCGEVMPHRAFVDWLLTCALALQAGPPGLVALVPDVS